MEIHGIGCDIVNIDRIACVLKKYKEKFIHKIFSNKEIALLAKRFSDMEIFSYNTCAEKPLFIPYIAKRFAAKEAFFKAMGGELRLNLKDIEILKNDNGKPYFFINSNNSNHFNEDKKYEYYLSLSDDHPFAIAYVIITVAQHV